MANEGELTFEDAESGGFSYGKTSISFREIVLRHLAKIVGLGVAEYRKGYTEKKPMKIGGSIFELEKYHEDGREVYSNAVDSMFDIVQPYFDKDMKEVVKNHREELEKIDRDIKDNEEFLEEKMFSKRKLWQQLNIFLKKKDYLSE